VIVLNISSIQIQAIVVTSQALIQNSFVIHIQLGAVLMHIFMAKDYLGTRENSDPTVIN
jgi:hypothetical protein